MNLAIEIISKEVVTPSSPTPRHLKKHNLSFLDQTLPPFLVPHVLFYPANNIASSFDDSERSKHLKTSLSQTLTLFYPLAGRLVGNSYVNCNDMGVTYIEAQANFKICDVITDPIHEEELNKFIPCNLYEEATDVCMIVQATFFCCGGLAIGLGISHKIADAFSYFMFVNRWAAAAISPGPGNNITQSPIFETATLFPPRRDFYLDFVRFAPDKKENMVVKKRFLFTAQKIADLRDKYTSKDVRPTRVEALSTFIWTRFVMATRAKLDDATSKVYMLRFPVDIRTRMVPSLSEYHFGNIILPAVTTLLVVGDEEGAACYCTIIVKKIRDAIRKIDGDYVAKSIHDEIINPLDIAAKKKPLLSEGEEVVTFRFSSLCRLPLYKADFGWGLPEWCGSGKTPLSNVAVFMDTFSGDGIEAWVDLEEEDMIKLKADEEFLHYVSC